MRGEAAPDRNRRRGFALALTLLFASVALYATVRGADRSRAPLDPREHVTATLDRALTEGNRSAAAIDGLRRLRSALGQRPLDSESRVQYAALLLSMTRRFDDTRAAAFHARSAAGLAPVTLPVVELAALVLVRSGDRAESLRLTRSIFRYDPAAGAALLARLEESVSEAELALGLADSPAAWAAWAEQLRNSERKAEATAIVHEAVERWPSNRELLLSLAREAMRNSDWDALDRWVSQAGELSESGKDRTLLAFRARSHAEQGRPDEARADLRTLMRSAQDRPELLALAGDVEQRLGDDGAARDLWNRALFLVGRSRPPMRVAILVRLAPLEERRGRASLALRHWREILQLEPTHARARRRVEALSGVRR